MHLMVEATAPEKRHQLVQELTGPFRTVGSQVRPEDVNAPAWWHGDEEAFESAQALTLAMPRRVRRRRR